MKKEQLFTQLSDEQAEKVVGGVGVGVGGGSTGFFGWGTNPMNADGDQGLILAGFGAPGVSKMVGKNNLTVSVPGPKLPA